MNARDDDTSESKKSSPFFTIKSLNFSKDPQEVVKTYARILYIATGDSQMYQLQAKVFFEGFKGTFAAPVTVKLRKPAKVWYADIPSDPDYETDQDETTTSLLGAACNRLKITLLENLFQYVDEEKMNVSTDVNAKDDDGQTPYQRTITASSGYYLQSRQHTESILILLVKHGLTIEETDIFSYAISKGMTDLIELLLKDHEEAVKLSIANDTTILAKALGNRYSGLYLYNGDRVNNLRKKTSPQYHSSHTLLFILQWGAASQIELPILPQPEQIQISQFSYWPHDMAQALFVHALEEKYTGKDYSNAESKKISPSLYTTFVCFKRDIHELVIEKAKTLSNKKAAIEFLTSCVPPSPDTQSSSLTSFSGAGPAADDSKSEAGFFCRLFATPRARPVGALSSSFAGPLFPRGDKRSYDPKAKIFKDIQTELTRLQKSRNHNDESPESPRSAMLKSFGSHS